MTLPVDRLFLHHEGAGRPRDDFGFGARFYTAAIGVNEWHIYRHPDTDIATKHFNHISAGIVFSGNRMTYPVTDHDLELLTQVVAELRRRGDITADPTVLPHRLTPGLTTGTVCPGNLTMARWDDVMRAINDGLHPGPAVPPEEDDMANVTDQEKGTLIGAALLIHQFSDGKPLEDRVRAIADEAARDAISTAFDDPAKRPLARKVQEKLRSIVGKS